MVFGVGLTVERPNELSMRMRERLASAAHAARRQLGVDIRELALHVSVHPVDRSNAHVAATGGVVLEFSLAILWRYSIWCGVIQADDILTARFPRLDPDTLPSWADALWRLSVEGRLAALSVRMPLETGGLSPHEWPASVASRRSDLQREIARYTDQATARRLTDRAWGAPLTWRRVCALGEEAHLPMEARRNESEILPRPTIEERTE